MNRSKIIDIYLCLIFLVMIGSSLAASSGVPVTKGIVKPTSGNAPLTITFTDKSSGKPTSWLWNFGDGTTSDEQNTVHTYMEPGKYKISLETCNRNGCKSGKDNVYITVIEGKTNSVQAINLRFDWFNKGASLNSLGRYQEALDAYDKALAIDPNLELAKNNKQIVLGKTGM